MTLAGIYLLIAMLGGLFARAVRLPPLLGFLVAGFVLSALGVENHPWVDVLANLGVTLMLFAVGLQIDVRQLLNKEIWLTAVAQSTIMTLVGVGALAFMSVIGIGLLQGSDLTTWLLIALALSFSSTVFVIKLLEERGDTRATYGQIAIGILVMQDLIAVAFLAATSGSLPSFWSLALFLLLPARRLIVSILERLGHGEMLVLAAVFLALDPGYILFESVGLKGDLGAVAIGMLLASHPRAHELSKSIFSVKELLLVAFFLSIGLTGLPSWPQVAMGLTLLVLLFGQSLIYFVLLVGMKMRRRTAILNALVMANSSEFALIIATTAIAANTLDPGWLTTLAVTVAASFILGSLLNIKAGAIADFVEKRWPDPDPNKLDPRERPVTLDEVDALVLGMGRIGSACYLRLVESSRRVLGIEHDRARVAELTDKGIHVLQGDAADTDLWRRVRATPSLKKVVLAMSLHQANVDALISIRARGFKGRVVAMSHWLSEADQLRELGADEVLHLYAGAGASLADAAMNVNAILRTIEHEKQLDQGKPASSRIELADS